MKKIYLFIFVVLTCYFSYGQENISLDQMLVNVDKSSVTSGIIYERVAAFDNLYHYNQTLDTANIYYFEEALSEMYNASNKTKFISTAALRLLYTPKSQTNVVDIGIINTQYQYLNYNSNNPSLGGLTLSNNLFYQISGKPPFNSSSVVVIAPLKENIVSSGTSFTYNFKSTLWFTNGTKTIKQVTAVLGDGISRNVIVNGSIASPTVTLTYTQSGYKYLKFTVTFSDNSTHVTYGKIYVAITSASKPLPPGAYITQDFSLTASIPFKGYDETTATPAQIQYRIFYKNGDNQKKLTKPIIISDGFDPGDKRKIQASDYIAPPYDPNKDRSIEDIMKYTDCDGVTTDNLITTLNARGYDVVVVNYPTYTSTTTGKEIDGGADFIERNAMAMVALIQNLNATLAANGSTEQLVVVGPSMGGQITRYALAYMEKQYAATGNAVWLHKTRLWLSVDSPNLGANIPEGLQALVSLLADDDKPSAQDFYNNQLGSAAAKQQLINWHQKGAGGTDYYTVNTTDLNGRTTSQGFTTNSGSSFYQTFYNNQFNNGLANSKGYPMNLRKIALANGSVTGKTSWVDGSTTGTYGTNSQQTLNIRGFTNICVIWCWDVFVAAFETYTMPAYGSDVNIARYKHSFTDRHTHAPNNDPRGNVDIIPGGWYPGYDILDASIMGQSTGIDYTAYFPFYIGLSSSQVFLENRYSNKVNCFIPTFSSLGMKNPNQDWGQSLKRNLVCSNEIPFDSYFGHDDNTQHTSFDCKSVNWLLKELDGTPQSPWFPMSSSDISGGPLTLCSGTNGTYNFASLCAIPSGATWTVSPNLQIISSSPTSITVKGISNGAGTITATFTNGEQVIKNITVGAPPVSVTGAPSFCNSDGSIQTWLLNAAPSSNGSNWNWYVSYLQSGSIYIDNPTSSSTNVDVSGGGVVSVHYTDLCGVTQTAGGPTLYNSCPRHLVGYKVIPNPAQNNIVVSANSTIDSKNSLSNLMYAIKITNHYGVVIKSFKYNPGIKSVNISLSGINSGAYLVSIFDGSKWNSQSLLIQK